MLKSYIMRRMAFEKWFYHRLSQNKMKIGGFTIFTTEVNGKKCNCK